MLQKDNTSLRKSYAIENINHYETKEGIMKELIIPELFIWKMGLDTMYYAL